MVFLQNCAVDLRFWSPRPCATLRSTVMRDSLVAHFISNGKIIFQFFFMLMTINHFFLPRRTVQGLKCPPWCRVDLPQARRRTRGRGRGAPCHARPALLLGRRQVLNFVFTLHPNEHSILPIQVHVGQIDDANAAIALMANLRDRQGR